MKAEFTVLGTPRGKGRPRFARVGSGVRTYTPEATASYENLIAVEYERQCRGTYFDKGTAIRMSVTGYLDIPASASKRKRVQMVNGELRPLKKVDSSNLLKAVEDALNGVAYHDDVQIVETVVKRYYGEKPRVEVALESIGG